MKLQGFIKTCCLTLVILLSCGIASARPNKIKLGTVPVEIRMHGAKDSIDNLIIFLTKQDLFGQSSMVNGHLFTENGNGNYTMDVPVETARTFCHLRIADKNNSKEYAWGIIELTQGKPYIIDCTLAGPEVRVTTSAKDGFNRYSIEPYKDPSSYSTLKYRSVAYGMPHGITNPRKIYTAGDTAWREVLRQIEEVYQPVLNDPDLTKGMEQRERDIINSNLAYFVYGNKYLPYDDIRKAHAAFGNRDLPPLEYYDFLNRIDFSHLTDVYPFATPYFLLGQILVNLPVGIEPIGETPVKEWQRQTAEKLKLVIHKVPDILPRMLSAASYMLQLDIDKKPLSPTQIKNITEGYDDDLGLIILNKNKQLTDTSSE